MLVPPGAYYDSTLPDWFCEWSYDWLRWPDGHFYGQPVEWAAWQLDEIIRPALGLRWEDGRRAGLRVVNTCLVISAKRTGKTMFAAALGLFHLIAMGEPLPVCNLYGSSKDMAARVFQAAVNLVESGPLVNERIGEDDTGPMLLDIHRAVAARKIECNRGGTLETRTGDADREVGANPYYQCMDEFLTQKTPHLWNAMKAARGSRQEQLTLALSTPHPKGTERVAHQEWEEAMGILERQKNGTASRADWAYLPVLHTTTEDDPPGDPSTWRKACPALDAGYMSWDIYESEWEEAQRRGGLTMRTFLAFRCARWVGDAPDALFEMGAWDREVADLPDDLDGPGWSAHVGLDMSQQHDLTSMCILWWHREDHRGYMQWRHWVADSAEEDLEEGTVGEWENYKASPATRIVVCPRGFIPASTVATTVARVCKRWNVESVGADNYRYPEINFELGGLGIEVQALNPGYKDASEALKQMQAAMSDGFLGHNGDELARWCANNSAVTITAEDRQTEKWTLIRRRDRAREKTRIDSISALQFAWVMKNKAMGAPPPKKWRVRRILGVDF